MAQYGSTIGYTIHAEVTLPLITKTPPTSIQTVTLTRSVLNNGVNEKRKAVIPFLSDEREPELILRLIRDFMSLYPASRLSLNTGASRFEYFRLSLGGIARDNWDTDATAVAGTTLANFETAKKDFLHRYLQDTSLPDQQTYLDTVKKTI